MKFLSGECHRTPVISQQWLSAVSFQASSHYLNQCWQSSVMLYGITTSHWVNSSGFRILPIYDSCGQSAGKSDRPVESELWWIPQTVKSRAVDCRVTMATGSREMLASVASLQIAACCRVSCWEIYLGEPQIGTEELRSRAQWPVHQQHHCEDWYSAGWLSGTCAWKQLAVVHQTRQWPSCWHCWGLHVCYRFWDRGWGCIVAVS